MFDEAHAKKEGNCNVKITKCAILWLLILSLLTSSLSAKTLLSILALINFFKPTSKSFFLYLHQLF